MAFGGDATPKGFGVAAALVNAGAITAPAGVYASSVNGPALAAGPFWQKSARTDRRSRLNAMRLTAVAGVDLLAALVGAPDITKGDTGQFSSAAAAANQHGLPSNFGEGRGNWLAEHIVGLMFNLMHAGVTAIAAVADVHDWEVKAMAIAAGDLTITVHNRATAAVIALSIIQIQYHQSLTG
jgi:hypothetical protein